MQENKIKTVKSNNQKGYRTRNVKVVNDKYFSVNSSLLSSFNDNINIAFGNSGKNTNDNFLSMENVLNILKGTNNYQKQQIINDLSDFFYNTNGVYTSLIEKVVSIPCFDRVIARGSKSKVKEHYIKLLRNINDKFIGIDSLRTVLRYGVYFGYLSYLEKNDNAIGTEKSTSDDELQLVAFSDASIIPLSPTYTKILSTDGKTYRIGIDVSLLNSRDLKGFPKEIYEAVKTRRENYLEEKKKSKGKSENTNIFALQFYVLDENRTITIKNKSGIGESCGRAQFVTSIMDLIYDMNLRNKKEKELPKVGKNLIYETYPEGSKGKGTSSLTQSQMDSQHDFIAESLNDLTSYTDTSFVSIHPGTKLDLLTLSNDLKNLDSTDVLKRLGTYSGVSMGFLNGENLKSDKTLAYLYEIMAGELNDFMVQFEKELNKVMRYTVKIKSEIKLPYISYLPTTRLNRKDYVEMYHRLFTDAGGSYQMYLASSGILPEIHIDLMEEEEELKFRDKFKPHPMASTSSWSMDEETTKETVEETETNKEVENEETKKTTKEAKVDESKNE